MHVDMNRLLRSVVMVELIKDEAHVGTTGLCCAAAEACEGVYGVVHRGEAVALHAGHRSEGKGFAVPVPGREHRVVCSMCSADAAGVPQGAEDTHRYLCLCDDATQHALSKLPCIGVLADEELVPSGVLLEAVWAVIVALCECEVWVDVVCEVA